MQIMNFTLNQLQANLEVTLNAGTTLNFSFEFLRVFSPSEWQKNQPAMPKVFHKKSVALTTIESVGKHGYRFIFNDGYQDLFTLEYLNNISLQCEKLWSTYLSQTNNAGNNREQSIDITQL